MDIKQTANTYLVLALLLGAMLPVMLDISSGMNTYEFLFITYVISTIISLIFVLASGKKHKLLQYIKNFKDFAIIAGIGLLNYAFLEFGISYAEHFVSAALATVVYRTYPILMLAFLPIVLKERISKYQVVALSLGLIGLYVAVSGGSVGFAVGSSTEIIVFLIAIAIAGALATVLIKKYSYDMESSMFIFNFANAIFFSLMFIFEGLPFYTVPLSDVISILYVGIVYNVFVGFMYYRAMRMLKTTFVTNVYFLSPFITFVFAYFILGESIAPYYVVIALLVTVGILIQKLDRVGGTYKPDNLSESKLVIFDVTGAFVGSDEEAIEKAIDRGGRVLATKINSNYRNFLGAVVSKNRYENVFTDMQVSDRESVFVKDILGVQEDEVAVIKVGNTEDAEGFFSHLSKEIGDVSTDS